MSKVSLFLAIALLFASFGMEPASAAADEMAARVEEATTVLREIMNIPEETIPEAIMQKAQAIAVIPGLIKGGLIVGGRHGQGIMVVRTGGGIWSSPAFINLTGLSIGWQAGVKTTDLVLVFSDKSAVDSMADGKVVIGAGVSVAAGPVGRNVEVGTESEFDSAVYSYSKTTGLFAGASVGGATLEVDNMANEKFYSSPGITAKLIFRGDLADAPHQAIQFSCLVARHSNTVQKCA